MTRLQESCEAAISTIASGRATMDARSHGEDARVISIHSEGELLELWLWGDGTVTISSSSDTQSLVFEGRYRDEDIVHEVEFRVTNFLDDGTIYSPAEQRVWWRILRFVGIQVHKEPNWVEKVRRTG